MNAADTAARKDATGASWKILAGLGHSGNAITLLPTTARDTGAAELQYQFEYPKAGTALVSINCIPTHALYPGIQLRYSIAIDQEQPQAVNIDTVEFSGQWSANVLQAAAIGTTSHALGPGKHTLTLRPLDPGVVFDEVVIHQGDSNASIFRIYPKTQF